MSAMLERHTNTLEGRQNMEYKTQPGHLGMMRTDHNVETHCCLDIMITVECNMDKGQEKF